LKIKLTPDSGYIVKDIFVNGEKQTVTNPFNLTKVIEDKEVVVVFGK